MPVRGLHYLLTERNLLRTEQLSALQCCRLGIQADYWLEKMPLNEPFQNLHDAIGGVPLSLFPMIAQQIEQFRQVGVKPLYVFSGLNISRRDKPFSKPNKRATTREKAWELYQKATDTPQLQQQCLAQAAAMFSEKDKGLGGSFVTSIIKFLHKCNVETFTAPYQARAQLAYFFQGQGGQLPLIHNAYGGLELLMFGVPSVIIDIDFQSGTFTWVDYFALLNDLQITSDQFLEICILAGFDMAQTFPPIADQNNYCWKLAYELVLKFGTGYSVVQHYANLTQSQRTKYTETFLRAKNLVEYHMIFDQNVRCRPLTPRGAPKDIDELIGPRLPDQIYYLISQNIVSQQVINNLVSGVLVEYCPFVDSQLYRQTINVITPLRSLTMGLISNKLHSIHCKRKVATLRWYDPNSEIIMDHSSEEKVGSVLANLLDPIFESEIIPELSRQIRIGLQEMDFSFVLNLIDHRKETGNPVQTKQEITTPLEYLATILLHSLQLRNYILDNDILTPTGKALQLVEQQYQEQANVLLDLLTMNHLNGDRLLTTQESYQYEKEIALLTRVFSLIHVETRPGDYTWHGPIDKELMAWNCIIKAHYKTLRNLLEMILTRIYLSGQFKISDYNHFYRVSQRLPFIQESSTILGLILKSRMLEPREELQKRFPNCLNIHDDLQKGNALWGQVFEMVKLLHKERAIEDNLFDLFKSANQLLEDKNKEELNLKQKDLKQSKMISFRK